MEGTHDIDDFRARCWSARRVLRSALATRPATATSNSTAAAESETTASAPAIKRPRRERRIGGAGIDLARRHRRDRRCRRHDDRRSARARTAGPACPTRPTRRVPIRCASTPMPANGRRLGRITSRRPPAPSASCTCSKAGPTPATPIPYATKPTAENDWVKTGPHIMIVGIEGDPRRLSVGREAGHVGALCDVGRNALRASDGAGQRSRPRTSASLLSVGAADAGSSGHGCLG